MRTTRLWEERGMDWRVAIGLAVIHLVALSLAYEFFSLEGLVVFAVFATLTGMGVTAGYHRLLTHGSFKTYYPVRCLFALCGMLSGQGPPIKWVADHRQHHQHSDQEGDPHSPVVWGLSHSHVWWTMLYLNPEGHRRLYMKYARDLCKDRFLVWLGTPVVYLGFIVGSLAVLFALGAMLGGWRMGMSFLVWGGFVRFVYVFHVTWLVNSATHMWGYRNYETTDNSRNLWWVALLAFGEGWHNNHHKSQTTAYHGFHRWWEFDVTWILIWILEKTGLAWDIQRKVTH